MAWWAESLSSNPARWPGFDSGEIRNFNFYPGTECMSFLCVLSCVVSVGGPVNGKQFDVVSFRKHTMCTGFVYSLYLAATGCGNGDV